MSYSMEYLSQTPPRCVRGVDCEPHEDIRLRLKADVAIPKFSCFGIRCNCGSEIGSLLGVESEIDEEEFWDGPLIFKCSGCGAETQIFDPQADGYDAEIGAAPDIQNSLIPSAFPCPNCGTHRHNVGLAFGYQMTDVAPDEFQGRDEDFFDACLVYARCTDCGDVSQASLFECA